MSYALELLFDASTTVKIREIWSAQAVQGLRRLRSGDPEYPHLSLFVADHADIAEISRRLSRLVRLAPSQRPGILLEEIRAFRQLSSVLFLSLRHDPVLKRMQERWISELAPVTADIWPGYRPWYWVPRVTLAEDVGERELAEAAQVSQLGKPIVGRLTDVVLVQWNHSSHWIRAYYPLGGDGADNDAWGLFNDLLTREQYFEAHEVLEELWRRDHDIRQQSAIWVSALFVHWKRAHHSGALKMLQKISRSSLYYPAELAPNFKAWHRLLAEGASAPEMTPFERMVLLRWARGTAEERSETQPDMGDRRL